MSYSHGGARPGAGRKSNAQIQSLHNLLNHEISRTQWRIVIRSIYNEAQRGNLRAAQLLLQYRFGNPYSIPDADQESPLAQMLHRAFREVLEEKRAESSTLPKTRIEATTP